MSPYDPSEIAAARDRFTDCISVHFNQPQAPEPDPVTLDAERERVNARQRKHTADNRRYAARRKTRADAGIRNPIKSREATARWEKRRQDIIASVCVVHPQGEHDWKKQGKGGRGEQRYRCEHCEIWRSDRASERKNKHQSKPVF